MIRGNNIMAQKEPTQNADARVMYIVQSNAVYHPLTVGTIAGHLHSQREAQKPTSKYRITICSFSDTNEFLFVPRRSALSLESFVQNRLLDEPTSEQERLLFYSASILEPNVKYIPNDVIILDTNDRERARNYLKTNWETVPVNMQSFYEFAQLPDPSKSIPVFGEITDLDERERELELFSQTLQNLTRRFLE
jgi:hypothetical protein